MTITITVEREGRGELTPAEAEELASGARQMVEAVIRGGGDYQSRRIALANRGERK